MESLSFDISTFCSYGVMPREGGPGSPDFARETSR